MQAMLKQTANAITIPAKYQNSSLSIAIPAQVSLFQPSMTQSLHLNMTRIQFLRTELRLICISVQDMLNMYRARHCHKNKDAVARNEGPVVVGANVVRSQSNILYLCGESSA